MVTVGSFRFVDEEAHRLFVTECSRGRNVDGPRVKRILDRSCHKALDYPTVLNLLRAVPPSAPSAASGYGCYIHPEV
jgi:hypothetical protein